MLVIPHLKEEPWMYEQVKKALNKEKSSKYLLLTEKQNYSLYNLSQKIMEGFFKIILLVRKKVNKAGVINSYNAKISMNNVISLYEYIIIKMLPILFNNFIMEKIME